VDNSEDIHVHVHIHQQDERIDLLMAKIDDLQTSFDQLNGVVRNYLSSQQDRIVELEEARDALLADDSVEDSKLEGLISAVDGLRADVDEAAGNVPTPVDPTPVDDAPVDGEPEAPPVETGDETPVDEAPVEPSSEESQ
jgi:hypothetical protein